MKRKILLSVVLTLVCAMVSSGVVEDDSSVQPPVNSNYRVDVQTSRNFYRYKELLGLTVKLYNDSRLPVVMVRKDNDPCEPDCDDVAEDAVDGQLRPKIIGYATLRYIGPRPVAAEANDVPLEKAFRLPLFGSNVVPGHSSRIISTKKVILKYPRPVPEVNEVEIGEVEPIDEVEVAAKYIVPRTGYYLLTCNITKLSGVRVAKAQKIIKIAPRKPSIDPNVEINEKLDEIETLQKQSGVFARINNYLMRYLLRARSK